MDLASDASFVLRQATERLVFSNFLGEKIVSKFPNSIDVGL